MNDDITQEQLDRARRAVEALADAKEEIDTIEGMIRETAPDMYERYDELRASLGGLQSEAKVALRELGPGTHTFAGHATEVRNPSTKLVCDSDGLIDRAEQRDEIEDLVAAGVIVYQVVPHQIGRLRGAQQAVYKSYLQEKQGTSAVVLPRALK